MVCGHCLASIHYPDNAHLTHSGRVINLVDYVHAYTRGHHVTLETGKKKHVQAILIELTLRFAKGASVAATLWELYLGNRGHWRVCKESHYF